METKLETIRTKKLTNWELAFTESLQGQLKKGWRLSEKQIAVLAKIERKHSDDVVAQRNAWKNTWNDQKREIAQICSAYYLKAGYFTDLADKILSDDNFIPTEKQYKAMCKNKFTAKVLDATFAEPKYQVGSMVCIIKRPEASQRHPTSGRILHFAEAPVMIVEVNASPVLSSAKGAKVYKVLPVGSSRTVLVEERHLKKLKKNLNLNLKPVSKPVQEEVLF